MSLSVSTRVFGSLQCRVSDALPHGHKPVKLVILCHGFGAPGDDLADFGPMLLEADDTIAETCRFVFPAAPIDLAPMGMPGGRAWWPINMARLAEMYETRDYSQLTLVEPPGMKDAGRLLEATISDALNDSGLAPEQLILGGFSQGAMVSTEVVLSTGMAPRLLALFSGTLLNRDEWTRLAEKHPGCAVLQSHGQQDQLLPFEAAVQLRDMLSAAKFPVEFLEFNGPHTIPLSVLQRLGQYLGTATE